MPSRRRLLPVLGILLLTAAAIYVIWPSQPERFLPGTVAWPSGQGVAIGDFERREMRLGLDLQGGTRLLLGATIPEGFEGDVDSALEGTIDVLRRRVDATGLAEAEITRQGDSNISVQLPGLTPEEARDLLGRTAQLRFCEPVGSGGLQSEPCGSGETWQQAFGTVDGEPRALTGQYLKSNAEIVTDELGNPAVRFEFQGVGPTLFEQLTSQYVGQRLAIFLDEELLSAPVIQSVISNEGRITGLSLQRAQDLVIQLNAGALPLELSVLQEQSVDATLGADSVQQSVLAGQIGFMLVALFMVLYYRLSGVMAAGALVVYAIVTLAVFKLIPVTLTLAGIGAFVLSVGMAVDANILIFERMKEEFRAGRGYANALDAGFQRAWPAIRDSNVTTLITAGLLFVLGGGIQLPGLGTFNAPLVQGFAIVLALGVLVSMFSAIVVTRSFMRLFVGTPVARRHDLFAADLGPSDRSAPATPDVVEEGAEA